MNKIDKHDANCVKSLEITNSVAFDDKIENQKTNYARASDSIKNYDLFMQDRKSSIYNSELTVNSLNSLPFDILLQLCKKLCLEPSLRAFDFSAYFSRMNIMLSSTKITSFKRIYRLGLTCKIFNEVTSNFILQRLITGRPYPDCKSSPLSNSSLVGFLLFDEKPKLLSVFVNLIKSNFRNIDFLLKNILVTLRNKDDELDLSSALFILEMLLDNNLIDEIILSSCDEEVFHKMIQELISHGLFCGDDHNGILSYKNSRTHAKNCLFKILEKKLIASDSNSFNSIMDYLIAHFDFTDVRECLVKVLNLNIIERNNSYLSLLIDKIINRCDKWNIHLDGRLKILLVCFAQGLLTTKSKEFLAVINYALSKDLCSSSLFFLKLCKISEDLRNTILPQCNAIVTEVILGKLENKEFDQDEVAILKSIIELETAFSRSQWLIIDYPKRMEISKWPEKERRILEELKDYVHYKNSWLPISQDKYQKIWGTTCSPSWISKHGVFLFNMLVGFSAIICHEPLLLSCALCFLMLIRFWKVYYAFSEPIESSFVFSHANVAEIESKIKIG